MPEIITPATNPDLTPSALDAGQTIVVDPPYEALSPTHRYIGCGVSLRLEDGAGTTVEQIEDPLYDGEPRLGLRSRGSWVCRLCSMDEVPFEAVTYANDGAMNPASDMVRRHRGGRASRLEDDSELRARECYRRFNSREAKASY